VKAAKSLLLQASDFPPKFRSKPLTPEDDVRCDIYDPDLSALVTTGEAESRQFFATTARAAHVAASQALMFRTAKEATRYWQQGFNDKRNAACITEWLESDLKKGEQLTNHKPVPFRFSSPAVRAVNWSVRPVISDSNGDQYEFDLALAGFVSGRAVVFLWIMSVGEPFPHDVELSIGQVLGERISALRTSGEKPLAAG
jgi:hypothetical protein